jgi:hypothetical protein
LYKLAGVAIADMRLVTINNRLGTASPMISGAKDDLPDRLSDSGYVAKLRVGFAADVWLANWDVTGLYYDNVLTDAKGDPVRIDPGGALFYRAQGHPKGKNFGPTVGEWDTLRDRAINPESASVFADMTRNQLRDSVRRVLAVTPDQIAAAVKRAGFQLETTKWLEWVLMQRRADLAERAGTDLDAAGIVRESYRANPKFKAPESDRRNFRKIYLNYELRRHVAIADGVPEEGVSSPRWPGANRPPATVTVRVTD